jgi:lysophospholipid acyltransferase (LPLAT)-like uncharacterized protein
VTAPLRAELRFRAAGLLGSGILTSLFLTCRVTSTGDENYLRYWERGQPVIFVLWHGRLLAGSWAQRGKRLAALVSQHKDGEYISRVVHRWGYQTVRGSSTRGGGAALRELVRTVRAGTSVVLTPDGPQGPRERMKSGALVVSQMTGAPMIPVATGADRSWWVEGWDRFQIPKPFSRVRLVYGDPVYVPRTASEAALETLSAEVERKLGELMKLVDEHA